MENLFFLLGMMFGIILTLIFRHFKTAIGYFKLEPYDEDDTGFYKINIRIPGESNERLLHANKIILNKEKLILLRIIIKWITFVLLCTSYKLSEKVLKIFLKIMLDNWV